MKKLLFISLLLLQISTVKTMDLGLGADQTTKLQISAANSSPNFSTMNKIKNALLWPIDTFENWHDYMKNEWKPGLDFSTLVVTLLGSWTIYAGISLIYLKGVVGTESSKGHPEHNRKIVEAFLQRTDHSKFQKFMNRIFVKPLFT